MKIRKSLHVLRREYPHIRQNTEDAPDKYDDYEIKLGLEIEREHRPTWEKVQKNLDGKLNMSEEEFYLSITQDHLDEISDYNTRLIKMEEEAEKEN